VLSNRLRIGRGEARRRLDEADDVGPRTAMTGQWLPPVLPNVGAAQAAGTIGAEHVRIIRRFFADLPTAVDFETRQACEADLARIASQHTPDALRKAADRAEEIRALYRAELARQPEPRPRTVVALAAEARPTEKAAVNQVARVSLGLGAAKSPRHVRAAQTRWQSPANRRA
jgi:hypothetical protein